MLSNIQSSGIHCKVATQNEVRRFVLSKTDYESLIDQVCQVFGFSKDSVVIKYADDEGDFVTVSSDEEVKFAIESAKGVLRLRVDITASVPPAHCAHASPMFSVASQVPHHNPHKHDSDEESSFDKDEEEGGEHCGDHLKWRKKHGHHEHMMRNPVALERCLQHMKQKRVKLQEKLAYLDSEAAKGNLGNGQYRHLCEKLRGKIAFFSSRIERLEVASRNPFPNPHQQHHPHQQHPHQFRPQQFHPQQCHPQQFHPHSGPIGAPFIPAPNPVHLLNKEELCAEYERIQNAIVALKFAHREAHLQLQLRRTNLQAATHRRPYDGTPGSPGPLPSEEQVRELKDALGVAKANEAASKAELHAQIEKLHFVQHQLKSLKQVEKVDWKARKAAKFQEKAAWKAEKMENKHRCRHNPNNNSAPVESPQPVVRHDPVSL